MRVEVEKDYFNYLFSNIKEDLKQLLRININSSLFTRRERELRIKKREDFREAYRKCGSGNEASKIFVKDTIKELIINKYKISQENIRLYLEEDIEYKFKVILYKYRKKYGNLALEKFLDENFLDKIKEEGIRELDKKLLEKIYLKFRRSRFSFTEEVEILCQKIYEKHKGNGVIDEILPLLIDGVSGGVSSDLGRFTVWVMYRGNTINLSFLVYENEEELKRICRNLCKSYGIGQLSEKRGYVVAELSDGSRAAISRPPFCESWSFFVRKFRFERLLDIEELIKGEGSKDVIELIKYLIRGEQLIAITGEQGSGKTTLLSALVKFIPSQLNIRVSEMSFELHLRKRYPKRNIVSFRETDEIDVQRGLDFTKKTDGNVTILGEVATMQAVLFLVQIAQTASSFTIFTHHAKSTKTLIDYIRNSLLMQGNFRNEEIALLQATRSVKFNIRLSKNSIGERFIESISEVVPLDTEIGFIDRTIIMRKNDSYIFCNKPSREVREKIYNKVENEREEFLSFLGRIRWG